jgi:glycosyltransferase involved in cell wall biosynthesis
MMKRMSGWPVPGALAFVSPRYGRDVVGGAEVVVRQLAERLADRGYPVEVLTTCALDHYTWANALPEGTTEEAGVVVRRFAVQRGAGLDHQSIGGRIYSGMPTTLEEQERWLNDGFRSAGVFHFLMREHPRYHTVVLTPYMFWTTYACAQIAPGKNVLRPCLHDEPEARLSIYRPIFRDARGITFNSPPEADLAKRILELPRRTEMVGEGVEVPTGHDAERFRSRYGIREPFLLYVGRRELGKNFPLLLSCFERLVALGTELRLVLAGAGDVPVPERLRAHIVDLGFIAEEVKHDAMRAALAVIQPSERESFSRVLMESWLAETPVLVYRGGAVTTYHARQGRGGLAFGDAVEFQVAVELLLGQPALRAELGQNGRRYVLERYTWDVVTQRFIDTISRWAAEDLHRD